jgi:hypothetical protein
MNIRHAAKYAIHNRSSIATTERCGCYYCGNIFTPETIKEWVDENDTALCPFCSVDAVLAEGTDCVISKKFLQELNDYWF